MKKNNWLVILPAILVFIIIVLIGYIYIDKSLEIKTIKQSENDNTTVEPTTTKSISNSKETDVDNYKKVINSISFTIYNIETGENKDYIITDSVILNKIDKEILNATNTGEDITGVGLNNILFTLNYNDNTSISLISMGGNAYIYKDSNILYTTNENIENLLKSTIN